METTLLDQEISKLIQTRLAFARQHAGRLRATNLFLVVSGILTGGLSTLLSALAASFGSQVLAGKGPGPWQIICGLVAVLSFAATICTSLAQQLGMAEKLAQALACTGRLAALEAAVSLKSQPLEEIKAELTRVLSEFHSVLS